MSSEAHDTDKEVDGTQVDKVNAGALGTLVAVGLLAMLSITAAVTALVRHDIEIEESEKAADANQVVISLKDAQRGTLSSPASYVDRGKGLVSLPIDLAKGLVVSELQRDPNSATPAPPPKAEAAVAEAAVDAGVTSTDAGAKVEPGSKGEPVKEKPTEPKPAPATSGKPAPAPSAAPAAMPKPTPTAATPGAESPGPVNH
jgi:methyl-accepting chemotaxis protein